MNTVKRADCLVFSHGRTVVNSDSNKSRHSSLVHTGNKRSRAYDVSIIARAYLGPKPIVSLSEIFLPMHCCFKSQNEIKIPYITNCIGLIYYTGHAVCFGLSETGDDLSRFVFRGSCENLEVSGKEWIFFLEVEQILNYKL